jgi:hypothetical protein
MQTPWKTGLSPFGTMIYSVTERTAINEITLRRRGEKAELPYRKN